MMNHAFMREITLFVLLSLMFANPDMIGTIPVMAQASNQEYPCVKTWVSYKFFYLPLIK